MVFYKDLDLSCNKIDTIILSGGAYYGLLYNGLIKFLEDNDIYNDIKTVYGVSIGALFALIINLRISYNDLENYIDTIFNPNEFINIHGKDILNILEDYGINDGSVLENSIKKLLEISGYDSCITFKELYEQTGINLNIGIVKVIANTFFILNYRSSPDYPVWLGIRASISVPVLFTPIKDNYFNDILVDGGVLNNLPIRDYLLNFYYSRLENNNNVLDKEENNLEQQKNNILDEENNLEHDKNNVLEEEKNNNVLDEENNLEAEDKNKNNLEKEKEEEKEIFKYEQHFMSFDIKMNKHSDLPTNIHDISLTQYFSLLFNKIFTNQHHHRDKYKQYSCTMVLDSENESIKKIKLFNNNLSQSDFKNIANIGYNYVQEYYNNILLKK